jgi:uncharacterized membrane protein
MNVNFQYNKNLAIEGSIMLWLTVIPYVGWVIGIIGIVLLLRSMKEFSSFYQNEKIYQDSLAGVKFYIIAIIAAAVAVGSIVVGVWSATHFTSDFELTAGFAAGLIGFLAAIAVACVFNVLAALHLRKVFDTLALKSGEQSFATASSLLWWGAILTIVFGLGLLLILIAWIFATIGFFTMKSPQYQQYNPQQNGYAQQPYTQPEQSSPIQSAAPRQNI